jgi:hypothetical protein
MQIPQYKWKGNFTNIIYYIYMNQKIFNKK